MPLLTSVMLASRYSILATLRRGVDMKCLVDSREGLREARVVVVLIDDHLADRWDGD